MEIDPEPKGSQIAALTTNMSQPLSPMWSPMSWLPTGVATTRKSISKPRVMAQAKPPMFVDDLPVTAAKPAPTANSMTPDTSRETSPLSRSSTANVQLMDEQVRFVCSLGSANVPATDIARIIEQMTEGAAIGEGSVTHRRHRFRTIAPRLRL
jgi:hypothetical protein